MDETAVGLAAALAVQGEMAGGAAPAPARNAKARSMALKLIRSCSRRTAGPNAPAARSR
jgi:hypothetical protein